MGAGVAAPLSVAQGLLGRKSKQLDRVGGGNDVHVSVGAQRLAHVARQCVDDDLLTTLAESCVPRGRFVKQPTTAANAVVAVDVAGDGLGRALGHVGD